MNTMSQQPNRTVVADYGRDEMNLIEFPFGPITPTDAKSIEVEHYAWDRETGKPVCRKLVVTGSDAFGLPRPIDEQVVIGLKALTQQAGFESRKVEFSQYQLCKTIGWNTDGRSYRRIESSLDRIAGTTFKFKDSWFDNAEKSWRSHTFHLIDNVELCSENRLLAVRRKTKRRSNALCSFVWNEVVWKSFQDGYIKRLDMDMFRKISKGRRREVPLRLFRWLDKRFYRSPIVRINVERLGTGTLGLAAKYPSEFRRIIQRSAQVLVDCKFMAGFQFANGKNHSGLDVVFLKEAQPKLRRRKPNSKARERAAHCIPAKESELSRWLKSMPEAELAKAEDLAIATEFGKKLERTFIVKERNEKIAVQDGSLIRKQYVKRFFESASTTGGDVAA